MQRKLSQALFLLLALGILTIVIVKAKATIHNICPYALICFGFLKGNLITFSVGVAALGILLGIAFMLLSMFQGRVFCGYICPLGTLQELVYALRKKRCQQLSYMYERKLVKLKYGVLIINIILVIFGLSWLYINLCPIYGLSRLPSMAIGGLLVLALILIGGFFMERLWCRFLCPYAALLNLAQKFGALLGIKRHMIFRNLERCVDCELCCRNCPMNLDILASEYVEDENCIHCLRCTIKCPKPGTVCRGREQ